MAEKNERAVYWCGDSKKQLLTFPKDVRVRVGFALSEAQIGRKADYSKPMSGMGSGVLEIVADFDGNAYRAVYAVKLGDEVYVLHAFQKKSKVGIKTPTSEIDLIKARLRKVRQEVANAKAKGDNRK